MGANGVCAFSVGTLFFIHFAGKLDLSGAEFWFLATGPAPARAATKPSRVRSDIKECSNSAINGLVPWWGLGGQDG
jgi:hypothetical protein